MAVVQDEDDEVVKATVVIRGVNTEGIAWCRTGMIEFLGNRSWVKRKELSASPRPNQRDCSVSTVRCDYEGDVNGVPLLKEYVREAEVPHFRTKMWIGVKCMIRDRWWCIPETVR
jgi:hypothetical protein